MNPLGTAHHDARQARVSPSQPVEDESSWQRDLAGAVRNPQALLAALGLSEQEIPELSKEAAAEFPLLVPLSFLDRMEAGNPHDPLLRQVLPVAAEQTAVPGFVVDAVGDGAARQSAGLLQKYHGRVLMIAAGSCAIHCRYCFRRSYPYSEEPKRLSDWEPALQQVADDETVREVILSGGDPLMLPNRRLASLVERIDAIDHIDRIRLHTRLPIVLPSRVDVELLALLKSVRAQVVFVVHANHANEIQGDCRDALQQLVSSGIPVLNQTVLLKGINDTVKALEQLSSALVNIGVMPYYLHQLDRVAGTAHFEASAEIGRRLIAELRDRLPGYAVPRFVQEIPSRGSKTSLEAM